MNTATNFFIAIVLLRLPLFFLTSCLLVLSIRFVYSIFASSLHCPIIAAMLPSPEPTLALPCYLQKHQRYLLLLADLQYVPHDCSPVLVFFESKMQSPVAQLQ